MKKIMSPTQVAVLISSGILVISLSLYLAFSGVLH